MLSGGDVVRTAKTRRVYRVLFLQHGQLYEIYAGEVVSSPLFGFVEVADLRFSRSEIIADPSEEKLRQEFAGVTRILIPYHAVVRVDEVEKAGASRVASSAQSSVTPFPLPVAIPKQPPER